MNVILDLDISDTRWVIWILMNVILDLDFSDFLIADLYFDECDW